MNASSATTAYTRSAAWYPYRVARLLVSEFVRQRHADSRKSARLFALRSLLAPVATAQWVRFLHDYYRRLGCAAPAGAVVNKPLRNYVARGLSPGQRVHLLIYHHEIAARLLPAAVRANLARNEALILGVLRGNRGDYFLKLGGSRRMYTTHEGELVLFMEKCADGCILAKISFLFAKQPDGRLAIIIGGLQGAPGGFKREVVDATRSLSALRPKDVVLIAVQAMAHQLGIEAVHAVSNHRHVIRAHKNHTMQADYDAYWIERQGRPSEPFGFTLPVTLPQASVPPNKRDLHKACTVSMLRSFLAPTSSAADESGIQRTGATR